MAVKIRLTRMGRHKRPFYRIVVADSRMPRDGRFIEVLGTYDPLANPASVNIKAEKAVDWLKKGAQMTDTIKAIFKRSGVMQQFKGIEGK
ncbi:MAG: 30S ribosomal protein S16 [Nitrospirae bacterium]|nr:30S ribosomal protein S16 [Nitrospirota bacterium]